MNLLKRYNIRSYKWGLVILLIIISYLGYLIVGSASESLQSRQLLGIIIGIVGMLVVSFIDYQWILKLKWPLYFLNIILLLIVTFFGNEVNGATRWIDLGFLSFQPSELTKIILVLFFAQHLMEGKEQIKNWKFLAKCGILFIIPVSLVLLQPDLSTSLSMVLVFLALIFLSGLDFKLIGITLLVGIPVSIGLLWYVTQPNQILIQDYQQDRIMSWLNPEESADGSRQQTNSIIAIGSGQLSGKGLDNNTTISLKNGNYLSEPQTDFIFAIIGEELGFVGCCIVITLLMILVMQCILIGFRCQIFAGKLICYGIASQIAFQSFINMSVATGLLPNTGIPLPFISYGLTSIVSLFVGMGIVLNIGLQQRKFQ